MTVFVVNPDGLVAAEKTSFAAERLLERKDLQRLLRSNIAALGEDLLVIAEEYGNWESSNRRIDLLCLSDNGDLVVVELKRGDDGGHMELQAIRYAAMVSGMTLEEVIGAYAEAHRADAETAREVIEGFLTANEDDEVALTGEVRIILVSADFSTEITTTVLWLNQSDLDITCIRLQPYKVGNQVLIDVAQVIPLPEAKEYEVKRRAQKQEKRQAVGNRQLVFQRFWAQLVDRSKARTPLLSGRSTTKDHWLSAGIGRSGFNLSMSLTQDHSKVDCTVSIQKDPDRTLAAFRALEQQRDAVETAFGGPLEWEDLPGKTACRIATTPMAGGWKAPESQWLQIQDALIDALIRLEAALRKPIKELAL